MVFGGCPQPLGCTLLLRGGDGEQLRRVKRVASFAAYAAYWGVLEGTLLSDQLAAAAAAMLGGDEAAQDTRKSGCEVLALQDEQHRQIDRPP